MKMTKMAGAVALTAALAMGTVPAFAASNYSVGNDEAFNDGKTWEAGSTNVDAAVGETTVLGTTYNSQLNATVPVTITIAWPTIGGDIIAPSASAYKITNNSKSDKINVVEITSTAGELFQTAQWVNGKGALDGESGQAIWLQLKASGVDYALRPSAKLSSQSGQKYIPIEAESSAGITLSGMVKKGAQNFTSGDLDQTITKITYTIGTSTATNAAVGAV